MRLTIPARLLPVIALLVLSLPHTASACSSCGCTLSSDWSSMGYSAQSGMHFDLRYDYLDQAQLRHGTGTVDRSEYPLPAAREIENRTINRYLTMGVDYSPNGNWGVNVQLPYISRYHSTWPETQTTLSYSDAETLGDIRILGRYQGFSDEHNTGVQLGVKLPTGDFHQRFNSGTEDGELVDRGLQAGTGTTDLLVGVYHFGSLSQDFDYFAQALVQQPMDKREGYYQGTSLNLNAGVRYLASTTWEPQLQLNAKTAGPDHGVNADTANSGGTVLYLSPGLNINAMKDVSLFGFVQLPLYQRVNGLQLAPRYTASVGFRVSF